MKRSILMLGTGHATVTNCYNTCFLINSAKGSLLVDAGGGNGILTQFSKSSSSFCDVHDMFITHPHTDHILGAVWVIRKIVSMIYSKEYCGNFNIYGGENSLELLDHICRAALFYGYMSMYSNCIKYHKIEDDMSLEICGMKVKVFDVRSNKLEQYGFSAVFDDGFKLTCLGDEPLNEECRPYAISSDLLMCEAFCLYRDKEKFNPYRKHHSTARDAAISAQAIGAKSLLLYHTEDNDLNSRKEKYSIEASQYFSGKIFVPEDLEKIYF